MFHCNETKSRPTGKDTLPALCRRLHSRDIGSRDNSAPQHGREDRQDCGFLVIFRNWRGGEGKEAGGRVSQQDLCWDPQGGPGRPGRGRAPGLPGQWQCSRCGSGASTRARCRWSRATPGCGVTSFSTGSLAVAETARDTHALTSGSCPSRLSGAHRGRGSSGRPGFCAPWFLAITLCFLSFFSRLDGRVAFGPTGLVPGS